MHTVNEAIGRDWQISNHTGDLNLALSTIVFGQTEKYVNLEDLNDTFKRVDLMGRSRILNQIRKRYTFF